MKAQIIVSKVLIKWVSFIFLFILCSCTSHATSGEKQDSQKSTITKTVKTGNKIRGSVKRIIDGDTFVFLSQNGEELKIRLYGIDTPERKGNQPFNRQATSCLTQLISGKAIALLISNPAYDKYKRVLAVIQTDDCEDVNLELIKAGLAWPYRLGQIPQYDAAMERAKQAKIGLWVDDNPISPADWKKGVRK